MDFKHLTVANWREPDPVNRNFGRVSPIVGPVNMTGDDWAREFLNVEVKAHVPASVRDLFAVARGALLYGWFFYPLFRLGEEQLSRVIEAAIKERYRQLGGPRARPGFKAAVEWLMQRGVIPEQDQERWTAIRKTRNAASHPENPSVLPPGHVLRILKAAAHDINRLFAREPHRPIEQHSVATRRVEGVGAKRPRDRDGV